MSNYSSLSSCRSSRRILLLSAVCLLSVMVQAQWRIGVSAGADYNHYTINTHYQTDYHYDGAWGWTAAVFGQYDFLPWVGLRAEIEATERNHRFYRTGIFAGTNYVLHSTYLQLPVMAQFSFGGTRVRGFVNAGVYAACLLDARYKGTWFDPLSDNTVALNQPYPINAQKDQRADFGLAGGVGVEYRFLTHYAMHIEARGYYSFISTVKPYMQIRDNRYNTTLSMNLGFSYIF